VTDHVSAVADRHQSGIRSPPAGGAAEGHSAGSPLGPTAPSSALPIMGDVWLAVRREAED
jgi:hypothetical protein